MRRSKSTSDLISFFEPLSVEEDEDSLLMPQADTEKLSCSKAATKEGNIPCGEETVTERPQKEERKKKDGPAVAGKTSVRKERIKDEPSVRKERIRDDRLERYDYKGSTSMNEVRKKEVKKPISKREVQHEVRTALSAKNVNTRTKISGRIQLLEKNHNTNPQEVCKVPLTVTKPTKYEKTTKKSRTHQTAIESQYSKDRSTGIHQQERVDALRNTNGVTAVKHERTLYNIVKQRAQLFEPKKTHAKK